MSKINRVNLGFDPLSAIFFTVSAAMTADSVIKMIEKPKISPVTIPGVLAERGISTNIMEQIGKSRQKLEIIHQAEIELAKKQEELAKRIAQRQALRQNIIKIAPFIVFGGVILGILLLVRRRK